MKNRKITILAKCIFQLIAISAILFSCSKFNEPIKNKIELFDKEKNVIHPFLIEYSTIEEFLSFSPKQVILIVPGGAFSRIVQTEGDAAALWFLSKKMKPYVLNYRHAPLHSLDEAIADILKAIEYIRRETNFSSIQSLGLVGFSAGGYLATTFINNDTLDINQKIDFLVLGYPVLSMKDSLTHRNTRKNIFKMPMSESQKLNFSLERKQIRKSIPVFLYHTTQDPMVPVEASREFAKRQLGLNANSYYLEIPSQKHGVAFWDSTNVQASWTSQLSNWLDKIKGL